MALAGATRTSPTGVIGVLGAALLAVLVYSGQIKANPAISWLPVDLTVTVAAAVCMLALLSVPTMRPSLSATWYVLVIAGVFVAGTFARNLSEYAADKTFTMFTVTLLALVIAPVLVFQNEASVRTFFWTFYSIGLIAVLFTLVFPEYAASYSDRLVFAGSDTIGTARMAAGSLIVSVVFLLTGAMRRGARIALLLSTIPLGVVLILTGSRAPLFSVALVLAVLYVFSNEFRMCAKRYVLAVVAISGVLVTLAMMAGSDGLERTANTIAGGADSSLSARIRLWELAIDSIGSNPLGLGWGGFEQVVASRALDFRSAHVYPHNIFLELLVEGGWIFGGAAISVIGLAIYFALRDAVEPLGTVGAALLLFAVFNAAASGDLNSARLMWVSIGFVFSMHIWRNRSTSESRRTDWVRPGSSQSRV